MSFATFRIFSRRIRAGACPPLYGKQFARALHRIGTKKDGVVEREHHANQPEAETDRRDDGKGGEWRAAERAERVEDVPHEGINQSGPAGVATLVGSERHRAEASQRPGACVCGAQARCDLLLRLSLDMERELLVEVAFDPAGRHQCTHA